jgi:hypothetical protein
MSAAEELHNRGVRIEEMRAENKRLRAVLEKAEEYVLGYGPTYPLQIEIADALRGEGAWEKENQSPPAWVLDRAKSVHEVSK